jgi:hypothetical protein
MAEIEKKIKNLPAESRSRVEEALKKTLETELANVAGTQAREAMGHSRSRGAVFSRSRTTEALRAVDVSVDANIIRKLDTMDDAAFTKFADRLATLKGITKKE